MNPINGLGLVVCLLGITLHVVIKAVSRKCNHDIYFTIYHLKNDWMPNP